MTAEHRHALPKGFEFEGYRIEGLLGTGGFGLTYRAIEIELGRVVAIKEYLPSGIAGREKDEAAVHALSAKAEDDFAWGLERYRSEAKTLVAFKHPNIVNVLRFFQAHGSAYLVMEFVEGETLEAIIQRLGPVPEERLRGILGPLLDGLENIHEAGFLHRDIKPSNILVRADGTPVLIDFGSARQAVGAASRGMTAIVSGGYAPVEQYTTHGKQGPWSDLYGLGATLYHAVTGEPPIEAIERVDGDELVPAVNAAEPEYSDALLQAIDACLALKRDARPQTVAAFRAILGGRPAEPGAKSKAGTGPSAHQPMPAGSTILATGSQAEVAARQDNTDKPQGRGRARLVLATLVLAAALAGLFWLERGEDVQTRACLAPTAVDAAKTITACDAAIATGSHGDTVLAQLYLAKGTAHASRNEQTAAISAFDRSIGLNNKDKLAFFRRARAHHAARTWPAARADYDAAIKLDAEYGDAYEGRGVLHFDTRQYLAAIIDLDKAIALRPSASALAHRGQSRLLLRDYKAALADFDAALALAPETGELYRLRGVAREFLGQREAAIADYLTALKKDPSDREAKDRLRNLGVNP